MKGILFKPDMIKAIVEGRKTVTRRLQGLSKINDSNLKYEGFDYSNGNYMTSNGGFQFMSAPLVKGKEGLVACKPHYHAGETVYIKEAWCESYFGEPIVYKLDGVESPGPKGFWRSPMFLSAKNARYFLQILSVRPEKLQAITEVDARREGMKAQLDKDIDGYRTLIDDYAELWDSINKANQWEDNPWVWRYEFKLVDKPVEG